MKNKLVERYNEIEVEFGKIQTELTGQPQVDLLQARLVELEAKQADLKKILMHLIALSKIRDEAWQALSHGARL
jgi:hypothetical protein